MVTLQFFVQESNYRTLQGSSNPRILQYYHSQKPNPNSDQQRAATEHHFPVVLLIIRYKAVLTFESVDPYSTEDYFEEECTIRNPQHKKGHTLALTAFTQHKRSMQDLSAVSQRFFLLRFLGCLFDPWFRSSLGGLN